MNDNETMTNNTSNTSSTTATTTTSKFNSEGGPSGNNRKQKQNQKQNKRRKRKEMNDSFYNNFTFSVRSSTGRPGTPHRYFGSSHSVNMNEGMDVDVDVDVNVNVGTNMDLDVDMHTNNPSEKSDDVSVDTSKETSNTVDANHAETTSKLNILSAPPSANNDTNNDTSTINSISVSTITIENYVVHSHVNSLSILTVGDSIKNILDKLNDKTNEKNNNGSSDTSIVKLQDINFMVNVSKSTSVGKKRKQANKMKRGDANFKSSSTNGNGNGNGGISNNVNGSGGMVKPNDVLAKITLSNGMVIDVKCCVCGSVMELNNNLKDDLSLLVDDPLLDGYVAIILPNGSFPPTTTPSLSLSSSI